MFRGRRLQRDTKEGNTSFRKTQRGTEVLVTILKSRLAGLLSVLWKQMNLSIVCNFVMVNSDHPSKSLDLTPPKSMELDHVIVKCKDRGLDWGSP